MKRIKSSVTAAAVLFTAAVVATSFVSCSKDDSNANAGVSQADAADAIEASVSSSSNGVNKMVSDASAQASDERVYTGSPSLNCGQQYSVTYSPQYTGTYYSYDYTGTRTYTLQCGTDATPQAFLYTSTISGTYETPTMYSNDSSAATVTITSLGTASTTATVNGNYTRNGYQESKVRQMRHFNSVITLNLTNIIVNKTTRVITGGTAAVNITGTGSNGASFTYTGSITFNGDNTALLVINGNSYTINL